MSEIHYKKHVYNWTGIQQDGRSVRGHLEGPNPAMIRAMLRRQRITPLKVQRQSRWFTLVENRGSHRIKTGDIANITRQLATLLDAGIPLTTSLEIMAKGSANPSLSELIHAIRADIRAGLPLAGALARHPRHFDRLFISMVAAGEHSGTLDVLLARVADHKEQSEAIKTKLRNAMMYPTAILTVTLAVVGVLLYFVVPQFETLYSGFDAALPSFTQITVDLSRIIQQWWWLLLAVVVFPALLLPTAIRRSHRLRRMIDRLTLATPVLGKIASHAATARFARTLATLFAAGIPLADALESVSRATGNSLFENAIQQMRQQVESGNRLAVAMSDTRRFPDMAQQLIRIGEEAGALDAMAARVADFYEGQVNSRVDNLSTLLEPAIMVIIGILVGGLVIAMYLPIFNLGSVI